MKFSFVFLCFLLKVFFVKSIYGQIYNDLRVEFDTLKSKNKLYSKDTVDMAVKIKKAMEENKDSVEASAYLNELKYELPTSVRVLIWSETTHLFNKYYGNNYMYPVWDTGARDEKRRTIYLWTGGDVDGTGRWNFTTSNDGSSYVIRSIHYNSECFYAEDDGYAYDKTRRNVYTWRPNTPENCLEWEVEIVDDTAIKIKFVKKKEYLYAASFTYSSTRRYVFTWHQESNCNDDSCVWIMKPEYTSELTPEEKTVLDDYANKFNLKFGSIEEKRKALRNINVAKTIIDYNNDLFSQRQRTYELELQPFSHYSEDEFTRKYLGLLPPPNSENVRRKREVLSAEKCNNLPNEKNWIEIDRAPKVKDQKECGSCYIFSSTGAVESAIAIEYGISVANMSIQNSLNCILDPVTNKQNGCTGGRPEWVWKKAQSEVGLVRESKPDEYTGKADKCNEKASKFLFSEVDHWEHVTLKGTEEEIEEQIKCWLATYGPMHIGMTVRKNDIGSFKSGIFKNKNSICNITENVNHGILLVGYGERYAYEGDTTKTKFWTLQNSWGTRWGNDGFFDIERNVNVCNFQVDARIPVLKKKLAAIKKPSVCTEAEDLVDNDNQYLKSLCLVEQEKSYEDAQRFCLENGMQLFRTSEEAHKKAFFDHANEKWGSKKEFSIFIDGIINKKNKNEVPTCTTVDKENEVFKTETLSDCTQEGMFVCEYLKE